MPWWAWTALGALVLLTVASLILNAAVIYALTTQSNVTRMEVCRLYLVLHRDQIVGVVIPPRCLP